VVNLVRQTVEVDEAGMVVTLAKKVVDELFNGAKEAEGQAMAAIDTAKRLTNDATEPEREAIKTEQKRLQGKANDLMSWAFKSQTAQR